MLRKILFGIFVVPLVLVLAFGAVNFVSAILAGDVSIATWVMDHKVLLALILGFIGIRYLNPWKK